MSARRTRDLRRLSLALTVFACLVSVSVSAAALQERSEEGFPLTFARTKHVFEEPIPLGEEVVVRFDVTNPTDAEQTYFLKSSSRSAHVTHKHVTLAPGETGEIEVDVKGKVPGPFRFRIGVVVEPTRGALFLEGAFAEPDSGE